MPNGLQARRPLRRTDLMRADNIPSAGFLFLFFLFYSVRRRCRTFPFSIYNYFLRPARARGNGKQRLKIRRTRYYAAPAYEGATRKEVEVWTDGATPPRREKRADELRKFVNAISRSRFFFCFVCSPTSL